MDFICADAAISEWRLKMSKYIPFPAYYDSMAVDISFVFSSEKPAGKHGFLRVDGDVFRFEDGTEGRFFGTNFNGGACFPEHEYSEKVARRLAQSGCNIVRFHQLDSDWNTPNIFLFSKGVRKNNTRSLDPVSMDRLDYLVHCLKNEGIYCYLDLLTYRKFKSGDGVEKAEVLVDAGKPYCIFDRHMIELQKEFATQLWDHFNPYTNLRYREDPVFVMCEIVNETDLYSGVNCEIKIEPYVSEFRDLFSEWLKGRNIEFDAYGCNVNSNESPVLDFKMYLTQRYYKEMYDHVRSIGVKIPLTGTNWTRQSAILQDNMSNMDFNDSHYYFYDWRWGEYDKCCMQKSISGTPMSGMAKPAKMRSFEKPFFMSEWDMPWPNPYRAESPIYFAAINNLQNWCGLAIHTYAYGTRLNEMKMLGKEVSSAMIGGIPYREGIFSTWNDPAKWGLFYHAALIVRRGDVSAAKQKIGINITALDKMEWTAMQHGVEVHQVGSCFHGVCDVADRIVEEWDSFVKADGEVISDNGQIYRNWKKGYGYIDSPKTKCVYGSLKKQGEIELNNLSVSTRTDFAVIAMSSLTDQPIEQSDNILLTTVGRARNTAYEADGEKTVNFGEPPILVEVIEAKITMRTNHSNMLIHAINAEGFEIGIIKGEYDNGMLMFNLGDTATSMYYLIQAE